LNLIVTVTVDRPMGSRHPRHGFLYPVNYGFIAGIPAPDGGDLDAYVLGVFEPRVTFTGICITVLQRLDDEDDKLIVVPEGKTYNDDQIRALTEFQEQWFTSVILRLRSHGP
jgi:inorganic pyrophosphatase